MIRVPDKLTTALQQFKQQHVLQWWEKLTEAQQQHLLGQLQQIDLAQIQHLYNNRDDLFTPPAQERIQPISSTKLNAGDTATTALGEEALRRGQVAALVVAGGQGSRLGFHAPKGMFEIGPLSKKSLFHILAEKIRALESRYACSLPLLVMTSPATDQPTREYFAKSAYFELRKEDVHFFCQATMPAVDADTGKLLLEAPDRLCLSPNGHGGVLPALCVSGLLQALTQRDIRQLFYFQIDNVLVKIADPLFLGHHLKHQAEVSTKALPKREPHDRVGNLVLTDGRCSIIEYSDLPKKLANQRDEHGQLRYRMGNTAIHIFDVAFLRRVSEDHESLPIHIAYKEVSYVDDTGQTVTPDDKNAYKFEKFIFDVLPQAERWTVVEMDPEEEYAPLKNKEGEHSPDYVRRHMTRLARHWLSAAGVSVPGDEVEVEISPLFALDADELAKKMHAVSTPVFPKYFQ